MFSFPILQSAWWKGLLAEVTVHVFVRVRYNPDSGSAPMPDPIHGEVRATYIVNQRRWEFQ